MYANEKQMMVTLPWQTYSVQHGQDWSELEVLTPHCPADRAQHPVRRHQTETKHKHVFHISFFACMYTWLTG